MQTFFDLLCFWNPQGLNAGLETSSKTKDFFLPHLFPWRMKEQENELSLNCSAV
jgi:hypothetical protein